MADHDFDPAQPSRLVRGSAAGHAQVPRRLISARRTALTPGKSVRHRFALGASPERRWRRRLTIDIGEARA